MNWNLFRPWKLCVSFHSHLLIPIGVIIRKLSNLSQIMTVLSWNVTDDFDKQLGASSSFVHHSVAICAFAVAATVLHSIKIGDYFVPWYVEIWHITLRKYDMRFYATSGLVHNFVFIGAIYKIKPKLWSGSVHVGIYFGCVTLTFDLRPWPFAWISGTLWKLCDGQTDGAIHKASWSQLKTRHTPITS